MNYLRSNRTVLAISVAVIIILIAVPLILWKTGKTPVTEPQAVLSPAMMAVPETTQKSGAPAKTRKAEIPGDAKKSVTTVRPAKVEVPASAEQAVIPSKVQQAETTVKAQTAVIPVSVSDQKKTEITTTLEKPAAPATVSLGIAPWGEVFVDGQKKGLSPPLNKLQMAPGKHTIEIRNTNFPPYRQAIDLKPGEQLKITYKFS